MQKDHDEYLKSLPKKRVAAGALFLNDKNEILIVKPTYKDQWNIPGGTSEVNESPQETCQREVLEEIGINKKFSQLIVIDHLYNPKTGDETLVFLFNGGVLDESDIKTIKLQDDELSAFAFKTANECEELLSPNMAKRLGPSLDALRDGKTVLL